MALGSAQNFSLLITFFTLFCTPATCQPQQPASVVVDLHTSNFTSFLVTVPATQQVLLEFYASWCPHCRHFKPKYEELARLLAAQAPSAGFPVLVARLDCAVPENSALCGDMNIKFFPDVKIGLAKSFLDKDFDEITVLKTREADLLLKEINEQLERVNIAKTSGEAAVTLPRVAAPVIANVTRKEVNRIASMGDIERTTVEIFEHILMNKALLDTKEQRKAFMDFVHLLLSAHPSARCRASMLELWTKRDELWPENQLVPDEKLRSFRACTKSFQKEEWETCRGTEPDSRGFTCGVWVLMHSLAARVNDSYGAKTWHEGISGYIRNFFGCKVCADHFYEILQRPEALQLKSQKDITMWLWKVHNEVNLRLKGEEEEQGIVDINFPKVQWPWRELCTLCFSPEDSDSINQWNLDEVYIFLSEYYKDPSQSSVQKSQRWMDSTVVPETPPSVPIKTEDTLQDPSRRSSDDANLAVEEEASSSNQGTALSADVGYGPPACILIVVAVIATLKRKSKSYGKYMNTKYN